MICWTVKLRHAMPEHDGLLHEILREPGFSKIKSDGTCSRSCEKLTEYYDVYIATAAMDVPTSFHDKYEWLREYFPF